MIEPPYGQAYAVEVRATVVTMSALCPPRACHRDCLHEHRPRRRQLAATAAANLTYTVFAKIQFG